MVCKLKGERQLHSTVSEAIKAPKVTPNNTEIATVQPLNRSRRLVVNRSRPATADQTTEGLIRSNANKNSSDLIVQSSGEMGEKDQSRSSPIFELMSLLLMKPVPLRMIRLPNRPEKV
mmetsp:Transcript_2045/g.3228  ORF Transcript_2045/g.3228 Transcript_2045/m.3228 type:complete len:118 (-) Transcript_2045:3690-4043(-)